MASSGKIPGVASSAATRALVKQTLDQAPSAERRDVRRLFTQAAGTDGNRHLSMAEAMMARDAYQTAKAAGAGVAGAETSLAAQIDAIVSTKDADGVRPYFTSIHPDLDEVIIGRMQAVVAAAAGKPVELHAMVFSFTDPQIADAILALAEQHPNVSFRLITDFSQTSKSGGRQSPRLVDEAAKRGLDNVHVKYKRDGAYVWSASAKRPVYNHGASKGLNHHKGMVALVDGQPVELITGSYNWSQSAEDSNYENLFVIDASNPANRRLLAGYQAEFAAFFNHADALNTSQATAWKRQMMHELRVAHGEPGLPEAPPAVPSPAYVPRTPGPSFDLNRLDDAGYAKLRTLVGSSSLVRSIVYNFATWGAFTSWDNLVERVPKVADLPASKQDAMQAALRFGTGKVLINEAGAGELMRSLKLSKAQANAILAARQKVGDFESVDELRGLPGISDAVFDRIAPRLDDDVARAFFSSKGYDDTTAGTGYAAEHAGSTVPVMGADGTVAQKPATLSAGVIDLLNRAKPGDTVKLALYGLSASTPEYAAIVDAASRGVAFKVVLNAAYNAGVAAALKQLGVAGLPVQVRIQKAKTMHQKLGVVNDDVFHGSANFSSSASSKHSEDRFVVKNDVELAGEVDAEFERIWTKSKPA